MATFEVKSFPQVSVSNDGMTATVDCELADGTMHRLVLPYQQLDWLTQALLSAAQGAYLKQVESGKLSPINPLNAAMVATGLRVLPDTKNKTAMIQMTGRSQPNEPLGSGSVLVGEELLRALSARLLEVLQQFGPQH